MNQKHFKFYMHIFAFLFFSQSSIYGQSDWTIRNPFPSHEMIKEMVWTGDKIIAMTYHYILTSPDGKEWTYQNYRAKGYFHDIVWTGKNAVCIGENGMVAISADGISWQQSTIDTSVDLTCIGKFDTALIAWPKKTACKPGKYYISRNNGVTWDTQAVSGIADSIVLTVYGFGYKDEKFIAAGSSGTILTSFDGKVWNIKKTGKYNPLFGVTFTDSLIVVVGEEGIGLTSKDAITWKSSEMPSKAYFSNVIWNNSMLVAVGEGGRVGTSPDGITWQISEPIRWCEDIVWTGKKYIAAGYGSISSTDGKIWSIDCPGAQAIYTGVAFDGKNYVACSDGTRDGVFLISSNGTKWESCSTFVKSEYHDGIVYNGKQFFTVTDSGIIITSSDGIKWTKLNVGTTNGLSGIKTNNNVTAIYDNNLIFSSINGVTWTKNNPVLVDIVTVPILQGNNPLIIPGNDTIFVSQDGSTWYTIPQKININDDAFKKIAWTGNKYYSVTGIDDSLLVSNNGLQWEKHSFFPERKNVDMYSIIWTGKELIAVGTAPGDTAVMLCSEDGTTWKNVALPPCAGLLDICIGDGLLVAVGGAGQILTRSYETSIIHNNAKSRIQNSPFVFKTFLTNNKLSIFFQEPDLTNINATFYNILGKKVYETAKNVSNNKIDFQLQTMSAGNYILNLNCGYKKLYVPILVK